jgi:hypothetical protein
MMPRTAPAIATVPPGWDGSPSIRQLVKPPPRIPSSASNVAPPPPCAATSRAQRRGSPSSSSLTSPCDNWHQPARKR